MTSSSKLIFFGTEQFSVPTLRLLLRKKFNVVAIVTKPDSRRGRGKKLFISPIKQIGLDNSIPVLQPEHLGDIAKELSSFQPDAGVLVSYGKIIPQRILNVFEPVGIVNLHPSALPKYRGPSPLEATILAGDTSTAISIMKLDIGMDTGPVYAQFPVTLAHDETKPRLSESLAELGAQHLARLLPDILSGALLPKAQATSDVSITSLITKADGVLDPTTETAEQLERKVRAYLDFPKARLTINGNDVIVTSAKVVSSNDPSELVVPCAQNSFLCIAHLVAPSGRTMSGSDFKNGYLK